MLTASWKGCLEGQDRQCSQLVERGEWTGIDSAHG